ncbi:hypothetical protein ACLNBI_07055 [Pseudomonas guariconensis]
MSFDPVVQKRLAKELAKELNFSAAEIETMPFDRVAWWVTD